MSQPTKSRPSAVAARNTTKLPAAGSTTQIPRSGDGANQPGDEAYRLYVWMELAIDLLGPAIRNPMIAPRHLRLDRRLLQYDQIIAASPRPEAPVCHYPGCFGLQTRPQVVIVPGVIAILRLHVAQEEDVVRFRCQRQAKSLDSIARKIAFSRPSPIRCNVSRFWPLTGTFTKRNSVDQ